MCRGLPGHWRIREAKLGPPPNLGVRRHPPARPTPAAVSKAGPAVAGGKAEGSRAGIERKGDSAREGRDSSLRRALAKPPASCTQVRISPCTPVRDFFGTPRAVLPGGSAARGPPVPAGVEATRTPGAVLPVPGLQESAGPATAQSPRKRLTAPARPGCFLPAEANRGVAQPLGRGLRPQLQPRRPGQRAGTPLPLALKRSAAPAVL